MKKYFILFLIVYNSQLAFSQIHDENGKLEWFTNFEKAKEKAQQENKPILMLFTGSDWCPPCRIMHRELFNNQDFINIASKTVLVFVDFPKRNPLPTEQRVQNMELNRKFHGGGVPTFVAITPDEKVLGKKSGYRRGGQAYYVNFFKNMIQKLSAQE